VNRTRRSEAIAGFVFLLPWLLGFVGLTLFPMIASLYLSFTKYDLLSSPVWIGLQNYLDLFHDERYLASVRVTLFYVFVSVPLKVAFALLLATLLNRGLRGLNIYRSIFYLPSLLGASVAVAVLWRQLFSGQGLVNSMLRMLGWQTPPDWLANPHTAIYTLILLSVWEFGSPMIIFLAGLRQLPAEYYEAARVDGANWRQQFFRITFPLLTPLVFFNLVLQVIGGFQSFTQSYVISGGSGGPVDSTLLYSLYLYQQAFGLLHMGYGTAMAWVLLLAIAIFTAGFFLTSRYWVFYLDRSK
jgi:multiple sugar transport system permease protein